MIYWFFISVVFLAGSIIGYTISDYLINKKKVFEGFDSQKELDEARENVEILLNQLGIKREEDVDDL